MGLTCVRDGFQLQGGQPARLHHVELSLEVLRHRAKPRANGKRHAGIKSGKEGRKEGGNDPNMLDTV